MEQFASNFPISNNISAANVEWLDRPTHNTDKSLSRPKEGGVGEREEGRVEEGGSTGTDHLGCRMNGVCKGDSHAVKKPLWPAGVGGECALLGTWAQAGWTGTWLARGEPQNMPPGPRGCGLLDAATCGGSTPGQGAPMGKFQGRLVFQMSGVQRGCFSQGSSSAGLWGCWSGGKCSPGILGFTGHAWARDCG